MRIDDPICCKGADRAGDAYLTEVWICLHLGEHVAMRIQTMDDGSSLGRACEFAGSYLFRSLTGAVRFNCRVGTAVAGEEPFSLLFLGFLGSRPLRF